MKPRLGYLRLVVNAGSNTAAHLAALVVSFVLAPVVLRALGDERYGAWSFVESFVAYLTLFDLGVAAALVRFVPRCVAHDDRMALNRHYSASLLFFGAGAAMAMGIGAAFDWLLLERFLPAGAETRLLFRLLVLNFALTLPLSVYPAMLDGLAKFPLKSGVRAFVLLLRIPLTLFAITTAQPLVALGIVITGCNVLEHVILAWSVHRALPALRFQPRAVDRATLRSIAAYGKNAFVAMMAGRLAFHTDAFVIGPNLGAAAITVFSFPARLVETAKSVLRSATTTLTAAFASLEAKGDRAGLQATFLAGSRAAWYAALPVQAGLLLLGVPFLRLWIGARLATAGAPILYILAPTLSLAMAQSVAARVLYGTGRLTGFARATIADGVCNLALSLALVGPLGVPGVAWGTAIPHIGFCLFVIAAVVRDLSISARTYLAQVRNPMAALIGPVALWSFAAYRGIDNWPVMFGYGVAGMAVYGLSGLLLEGRLKMPIRKSLPVPQPWRRAG